MAPAEPAAAITTCVALSFNGRTSDSDSLDRGSNPWGATITTSHDLGQRKILMKKSSAAARPGHGARPIHSAVFRTSR